MFEFCSAGPFLFVFLFFIIIFLLSLPSISTIYLVASMQPLGLPRWLSGKEFACQCWRRRRRGFNSWVGKISWRRKCQPTAVFLPGEFHGQRSLMDYSPWGCKESDTTEPHDFSNIFYFIQDYILIWIISIILILLKNNNTNYVLGIHGDPQILASIHAIG